MGKNKNKNNKKFGEILIKNGFASENEVKDALKDQKAYLEKNKLHKKIGAILCEKGILSEEDIRLTIREQEKTSGFMRYLASIFNITR